MLVKQQRIPPEEKFPFSMDDLVEFKPFMRAFAHPIQDKTDSDNVYGYMRLYYLDRFTRGEPRDLITSCQHMNPQQGFKETIKLLQYHYGNETKIATAYMNRALNWPQNKSDKAKALHIYVPFLTVVIMPCISTSFKSWIIHPISDSQ